MCLGGGIFLLEFTAYPILKETNCCASPFLAIAHKTNTTATATTIAHLSRISGKIVKDVHANSWGPVRGKLDGLHPQPRDGQVSVLLRLRRTSDKTISRILEKFYQLTLVWPMYSDKTSVINSAVLPWRQHTAHGSASCARVLQPLALEFDRKTEVV